MLKNIQTKGQLPLTTGCPKSLCTTLKLCISQNISRIENMNTYLERGDVGNNFDTKHWSNICL